MPSSETFYQAEPYTLHEAEIVERIQESPTIFTLRLRFTDPGVRSAYRFAPGQFNMVYLYGVGEIPISIVSDPEDPFLLDHTIRIVGRVTRGMARLQAGDRLGIRGPYGRGWPLDKAGGRDVILVTGGLGCAPLVSVINYIIRRREQYGRFVLMQGVKHSDELLWRAKYERWSRMADTQVLLAADVAGSNWPWLVGRVTALLEQVSIDPMNCIVMMCGPEIMMRTGIDNLLQRGVPEEVIWLSMERNMQCGVGHCGHCQLAGKFVCRDGPVFCYQDVKAFLGRKGF